MPTNSKELIDFDLKEYRKYIKDGDSTYISRLSLKMGLNNGKGFSQPYVYHVIHENVRGSGIKFENKQIEDLFKGVIKLRLITEYYGEQKEENNNDLERFFKNIIDDDEWATIVNHYRKSNEG